jgi:F-type H+-transporting ATPase subunit b
MGLRALTVHYRDDSFYGSLPSYGHWVWGSARYHVKPQEMDQTLRQLGDLLLGSVPTILLFVLTYLAYRLILHKPLERTLRERHERTAGALEKARADVAAAEAKTAEYEQRLSEARMAIFRAQETRRKQALEARNAAVAEARARASAMVSEARAHLEREKQAAAASLQAEAEKLAAEVIRTILKPAAVHSPTPAGGVR